MRIPCRIITALVALVVMPLAALAAELFVPAVEAVAGKSVTVPVMLDKVDNLAGLKVAMVYDETRLGFEKAVKTEKTAGLMHVVNDTKPGQLIIVMAGARGVRIDHEAVINLHFMVKPEAAGVSGIRLRLTEVQLMSEQLKDIPCTLRFEDLVLKPSGTAVKAKAAP